MSDTGGNASRITKVDMIYQEFERKLRELLPLSQQELRMSDRLEDIIPPQQRRRVWQELRVAGFDLPELNLPPSQIPQGTGIDCFLVLGEVLDGWGRLDARCYGRSAFRLMSNRCWPGVTV